MATKVEAPLWAEQEAALERVTAQQAALEERTRAINARLQEIPFLKDQLRAKAHNSGESSWDLLRPLTLEGQELEAELAELGVDREDLNVRASNLGEAIATLKAEAIDAEAYVIRERQAARLRAAGQHVQALADLYAEVVSDEQELALQRDRITETLGRANHGMARPLATPLAPTVAMWLDQLGYAATSDIARRGPSHGPGANQPELPPAWLDAIPDLRGSTIGGFVEGTTPYRGKVLGIYR